MEKKYIKRIIDKEIETSLKYIGAINIVGPKLCGKTSTSLHHSNSHYYMQEHELWNDDLFRFNKEAILNGDKPRLIDEWQLVPKLWDSVRFWVDQKNEFGLFILTGSININRKTISHSGAGRILQIEMNTMSLYESNDSTGQVSLKDLFDNKKMWEGKSDKNINDIAYYMCRGGWPTNVVNGKEFKYKVMLDSYVKSIYTLEKDNNLTNKKIKSMDKLINSISRNIATQIKVTKLMDDIENKISRNTLDSYINYLKDIYVINELKIWSPSNFRSKTRLLTTPKTYFCDQSIGLNILNINENNIFEDINTFGLYFENMVIRDLKIYSQANEGKVYFYRTENGFEIDAIIQLDDGRWGAIEIKLGDSQFDKAAKNLLALKEKVNAKTPPSFLAIVTAYPFCYQRNDGVFIIPIQVLKD